MLKDIFTMNCKHCNEIHHKIYNGKYRICIHNFRICLIFTLRNGECSYIPLTTENIHEIISASALNSSLEGELFYKKLSVWKDIAPSGIGYLDSLRKYYGSKHYQFIKFLLVHRYEYVRGEDIKNEIYVKFYFENEPSNIAYSDWGRSFINYNQQLFHNNVIYDVPNGSGLSAGYFDKVFLYFSAYKHYGEHLLIVHPIKNECYRLNDYECLGDRYWVEQKLSLTDPNTLAYFIKGMSNEARESFLSCDRSNSIRHSYGQIDRTINIMKDIDAERYGDAIHFLEKLMIKQNANCTTIQ